MIAVCGALNPLDPAAVVLPGADPDALAQLAAAVPPMRGGELGSASLLEGLWLELSTALTERAAEYPTGVQGFLKASHSAWHVAGRVCLHLAENKREPFTTIGRTRHSLGSACVVLALRPRLPPAASRGVTPPPPPSIGSFAASPPSGNHGKL